MAFGRGIGEQKPLSVVKLCQMHDGLIYVNTNNVIECVLYGVAVLCILRVAVLCITEGGSFMYTEGGSFMYN